MLPIAGLWLARCFEEIDGIQAAALFMQGAPEPAACWPDPDDPQSELVEVASASFAARRATTRPRAKDENGEERAGRLMAIPIELGRRSLAVVAMTCRLDEDPSQALIDRIEAAGRWLPILLSSDIPKHDADHELMTRLVTSVLEPKDASAAYLALVSELATALGCDRVSLGFCHDQLIELEAVSHSARFDPRTRLGRAITAAMEEAIDAESSVRWPGEAEQAPHRAHASLCQSHEMACAVSVPLAAQGEAVGAICAEYRTHHPAGPMTAARMERFATILGPLVALRRDQALPVMHRIARGLMDGWRDWMSTRRRTRLVLVLAGFLVMSFLAVLPRTHRIASPARLEGLVQRAIVAPIDGFIAESRARAGDIVGQGDILGAIDDTDLRLELRKWTARSAQLNKEYRVALAARDRSEASILRARLAQCQAELDRVEEQLSRTVLVAPFDGIVAKGDLSRSLGSPVQRGDVLFEVAPLDQYRIVLEIDETEIDEIELGQHGSLRLTAQPGQDLALIVERVVPVAISEDGRNYFRVEAKLEEHVDSLRPGMEGVGKIDVGRRSQLWILTHPLVDWFRLRLWAWLP